MKKVGAVLLAAGLIGFFLGLRGAIADSPATQWVCLGVAIIGTVLILAPEAKTG